MKKFLFLFLFFSALTFAQIKFDAEFESGNLNTVSTNDSVNYTVTSVEDIGGRWFYFRISGVKDKQISVTVQNSDVHRPFYSYDNINFTRFTESESPYVNFFRKKFEEDTVYVSYYTPYNFSMLQEKIGSWKESKYVEVDTIGMTDRDLPMQEIRITDPDTPDDEKYRVWIHARTHPGETPSSYHFEGIVNELLKDSGAVGFYRQRIVFHLIPTTNPEGVYYGRSRTNFDGVDIESNWDKPEDQTTTEVKILKQRMIEVHDMKVLSFMLNLHSIASPSATFYIHTAESTNDVFYRQQYQFCNLNASDNPYVQLEDFSESALRPVYPEGFTWALHGDKTIAITYETPYDQYSTDEWVTDESLREIGARTLYSIVEYLGLSHPEHLLLDNSDAAVTGTHEIKSNGLAFLGGDYCLLPAGDETSSVSYSSDQLKSGLYKVYGWWPESNNYSSSVKFEITGGGETHTIEKSQRINGRQWNLLQEIELEAAGNIGINVSKNTAGTAVADAFRIVYAGPSTGVEEEVIPEDFALYQNYPNPFNPSTTIRFSLNKTEKVKLSVYNALGELVDVLFEGEYSRGSYEVTFNSAEYKSLASGVYYCNLRTSSGSVTRGMVLIK